MGVNGVTEVTNNIATTYTSTVNAPVEDKKKDSEVKVKAEAAAVYEKSEDSSSKASQTTAKETDRTKIIQQLKADDQNDCRHHKTGQIFHPGVSVRMVFIRRLSGDARSYQRDQRGDRVSHVVGSVRNHRDGIDRETEYDLHDAQETVGQNAQRTSEPGVSVPYFRIFVVFIVLYELFPEKFFHADDPHRLYYISNK